MSKTQSNVYLNQILRDYTKILLKEMKNHHFIETNKDSNYSLKEEEWEEFICDASINYFQDQLVEQQARLKRKIQMESLIDLYQYLMDPLSDKKVNSEILSQFQFHPETIQLLTKYFPQLQSNSYHSSEDGSKAYSSTSHGIFIRGNPELHSINESEKSNLEIDFSANPTTNTSLDSNKLDAHKPIDFSRFFSFCLLLASEAQIISVLQNSLKLFSNGNRKITIAILRKCLDWIDPVIEEVKDRMIFDCFIMKLEQGPGIQTKESLEVQLKEAEIYATKENEKFREDIGS